MFEKSEERTLSRLEFEFESENFKTPDQLPKRADLSQIPENVIRSQVIESLINQNDDLMSRLSVSLRRIAALEENLASSELETSKFKSKIENLQDQSLVLKEQVKTLTGRILDFDNRKNEKDRDFQKINEQLKLYELRYAELYTTSQKQNQFLQNKTEQAYSKIHRYQKYRINIKKALATFREEFKALTNKNQSLEATVRDLRTNLNESTNYITTQAKDHKEHLARLTEEYENEIRSLKNSINELQDKNKLLLARANEADRLFNEKIEIENQLIIAQRQNSDVTEQHAKEISELQVTLAKYRSETKELAAELTTKSNDYTETHLLNQKLSEENVALLEQVENLQVLWREQQTQIEKFSEQKKSLQKLNQELSISINEYRRELRELKNKAEQDTAKTASLLNTKNIVQNSLTEATANESEAPDLISKIDKALSNLHFGR